MRLVVASFAAVAVLTVPAQADKPPGRDRAAWMALAKGGFALSERDKAIDVLLEMNALLGSPDPVLRDDVAFSAAERWILRERRLTPAELRQLLQTWTSNLEDGLGERTGDRVFKRSFSALSLSLIAAADLTAPVLEASEVQALFDRLVDYFERENDLRGFDSTHGWMHTIAHTADALKFLSRNSKLAPGSDRRLLPAVAAKIASSDGVFVWGENDRMALALQSAVRRDDADGAALEAWVGQWVDAHKALWAGGPHVDAKRFARVENGRQVLRSLHAALALEVKPTSKGDAARVVVLAGLAKMR